MHNRISSKAAAATPSIIVAIALLLLTAACMSVGPDYVEPETELSDAWNAAATAGVAEGEAPLQSWWILLDDPQLSDLVSRAQNANLDLRTAVWRVEEARALRGVAAGVAVPQVQATGSSSRYQPSDNGVLGDSAPPGGFESRSLHEYGLGAGWEIDLWGKVRRSIEAADAQLDASVESYRDVLVSVLAEVGLSYVEVRSQQQRIHLARANVELQQETMQLTQDRFNAGLVSALDMAQAESNLANTESLIPVLDTELEAALNRLAVLLGETPGALHQEFASRRPIPEEPDTVAVGLPADLLRQRPDVRRSERELAAQTARIGVATADLYPSFSLSGFLGLEATSFGDLGSGSSLTWSVGLPIRWNIFSGGRIRSQIRVEESRTEQALAQYEKTVLSALAEVETALAAFENQRIRRAKLEQTVDATERSLELVLTQYRSGLTDFQNVLDTQRSLLGRQDDLASSEGRVVAALIDLYRVLGGGWDPQAKPAPPAMS